jgi:hypothetical protein
MVHRCSLSLLLRVTLVVCGVLAGCDRTCPPGMSLTDDACTPNLGSSPVVVADGGEGGTNKVCTEGELRCTGSELETCDTTGQKFVGLESCGSPALCSLEKRRCLAPSCEPDQYSCGGDSLQRCNGDLTGFELVLQCDPGLCDKDSRSCRTCAPKQTRCAANVRETCDEAGTAFVAAACPMDAPVCVGDGECAECSVTSDCKPRACHVAACSRGTCAESPEPEGARNCRYADGTTIRPPSENGEIYVIAGGAAFHIIYPDDLEAYFGGLSRVIDTPDTCGMKPATGTNLQELSSEAVVRIGPDNMWHQILNSEDLVNNCGGLGSVRKIPDGGLEKNGITQGTDI